MSEDRKKPTAGFWISVALVAVLVGYPLSFGPACWWFSDLCESPTALVELRRAQLVYWPIGSAATHGPRSLTLAINWYATIGLGTKTAVYLPAGADDGAGIVCWSALAK